MARAPCVVPAFVPRCAAANRNMRGNHGTHAETTERAREARTAHARHPPTAHQNYRTHTTTTEGTPELPNADGNHLRHPTPPGRTRQPPKRPRTTEKTGRNHSERQPTTAGHGNLGTCAAAVGRAARTHSVAAAHELRLVCRLPASCVRPEARVPGHSGRGGGRAAVPPGGGRFATTGYRTHPQVANRGRIDAITSHVAHLVRPLRTAFTSDGEPLEHDREGEPGEPGHRSTDSLRDSQLAVSQGGRSTDFPGASPRATATHPAPYRPYPGGAGSRLRATSCSPSRGSRRTPSRARADCPQ